MWLYSEDHCRRERWSILSFISFVQLKVITAHQCCWDLRKLQPQKTAICVLIISTGLALDNLPWLHSSTKGFRMQNFQRHRGNQYLWRHDWKVLVFYVLKVRSFITKSLTPLFCSDNVTVQVRIFTLFSRATEHLNNNPVHDTIRWGSHCQSLSSQPALPEW